MLKQSLSIVLAIVLFQTSASAVYAAPQGEKEDRQIAKLKQQVTKRVTDKKTSVKIKLRDGTEVKGKIQQIAAEDFIVLNEKTGDEITIAYREVAKLRGRGLSTGAKTGIAVAVGAVAVVAIVAIMIARVDVGPFSGLSLPILIK